MDYEGIRSSLEAVGKPPVQWECPDGSRVLVLPHGGRILGLFTADEPSNFFWTNPALSNIESARSLFENKEWQNSGGDRTWLAPEVDFFLPEYPQCNRHCVQPALDPGKYSLVTKNDEICLNNRAVLNLSRHKRPVHVTISKSIGPALNPLRHEWNELKNTRFAGYELRCKLQLDEDLGEGMAIGLWNLLQLPHGGDMLVPTLSRAKVRTYLGDIARKDIALGERLVRYKMHAPGEQKLGVEAFEVTGRAGYIYGFGNDAALVIRSFKVDPGGQYVDIQWHEPDRPGTAFQACNVNNEWGAFSELEYHAPAIQSGFNDANCEDVSQVWAFRGAESEIRSVAQLLLSTDI